jgi:hypothetical protein
MVVGKPATATTPWVSPATTWTFSPFTRNQRVFFRVAAINAVGMGPSVATPGFITVQ